MQDWDGYLAEINRLKEQYKGKIQIYLGCEEDAFSLVDRSKVDYLIGSLHYVYAGGAYYSVDSGYHYLEKCLEVFKNDRLALARSYYDTFCKYIRERKPDVIGHFDLITKFDESNPPLFLGDAAYEKLAERYIGEAAKTGCIFEVNTGAIVRGLRTAPYPNENLLRVLKKAGARLMLSSDSHSADTLDAYFEEAKALLRQVGFDHVYMLHNYEFVKDAI
jgi:histidinol-phosphatase (PHP family)